MPTTKKPLGTGTKKTSAKSSAPRRRASTKKAIVAGEPTISVVAHAEAPTTTVTPPVSATEEAVVIVVKKLPEGKYIYARGRRKTAVAQVRLWTEGTGQITVNGKDAKIFFPVYELHETLRAPLKAVGYDQSVRIEVITAGGGQRGQAEATRLGIARALIALNPLYRQTLKKLGFLMRDPREKERKKPGLKKARKGSQWAKR